MRPSLPPFALLAGPIDTAGDARAAAKAIPAGVATAEAAATALSACHLCCTLQHVTSVASTAQPVPAGVSLGARGTHAGTRRHPHSSP
eukprot:3839814-Rhodomonas_salina.1